MVDVFFLKITYPEILKNPQRLIEGLKASGLASDFIAGQFIGIKTHFGEKGNSSHINPLLILAIAKNLRQLKTKPFLFETNTLYRGQRQNAIDHINLAYGHNFDKPRLPIVIADGIKGNDYIEVTINQKHFQSCYLGAALKDMDYLLVLSHLTGHMLTGFGAAIKNLGMGCASRRGKLAQHCQVSPQIKADWCNRCGSCAQICPQQAIIKSDSGYSVDNSLCIGCAQCITVCPKGAVEIVWSESYQLIQERVAEYALAAVTNRRCGYINFCLFLTKDCDCMNKEKESVACDLGIFFSKDPVAIDRACLDQLSLQENRDVIQQLYPQINYQHGLEYAASIGLGSLTYNLIKL